MYCNRLKIYLLYDITTMSCKRFSVDLTESEMNYMSNRKDNKGRVLNKGESQLQNNKYKYRWTDRKGDRQVIYANSLNELREKELQLLSETLKGVSRKNITLNEMIETFFKTKKWADSTRSNYEYYYNHLIKKDIGKFKITELKKSDVLIFYKKMSNNGLKNGTIKILQKIISPTLQLAVDDELLLKNPCSGCMKDYKDDTTKKYALSFDQENEFLNRVKNHYIAKKNYNLYAILLNTGMRISEVVGLRWKDIDFENRAISINHQLQQRTIDGKLTFYCTDGAKTPSGVRDIHMNDKLYELFKSQRKEWFSLPKEPDYEIDGYKDFVFISYRSGNALNINNIRKQLKYIVNMNDSRDIKLPNISPHIFRHTYATRLAEAGVDIKVAQKILGQTDIRTTIGVYNHVDESRELRELEKLDDLYKKIDSAKIS